MYQQLQIISGIFSFVKTRYPGKRKRIDSAKSCAIMKVAERCIIPIRKGSFYHESAKIAKGSGQYEAGGSAPASGHRDRTGLLPDRHLGFPDGADDGAVHSGGRQGHLLRQQAVRHCAAGGPGDGGAHRQRRPGGPAGRRGAAGRARHRRDLAQSLPDRPDEPPSGRQAGARLRASGTGHHVQG